MYKFVLQVMGKVREFKAKIMKPINIIESYVLKFQSVVKYANIIADGAGQGFDIAQSMSGLKSVSTAMGSKFKLFNTALKYVKEWKTKLESFLQQARNNTLVQGIVKAINMAENISTKVNFYGGKINGAMQAMKSQGGAYAGMVIKEALTPVSNVIQSVNETLLKVNGYLVLAQGDPAGYVSDLVMNLLLG